MPQKGEFFNLVCDNCGGKFERPAWRVRSDSSFCSVNCRQEFRTGENHPRWKDQVLMNGYVFISSPNHPYRNNGGYVREHRLVYEGFLGRYLSPEEEVHHKDGNGMNNDLSNLELYASHSDHIRLAHGKGGCSVDGCNNPHRAKGYCSKHYQTPPIG